MQDRPTEAVARRNRARRPDHIRPATCHKRGALPSGGVASSLRLPACGQASRKPSRSPRASGALGVLPEAFTNQGVHFFVATPASIEGQNEAV